jgi:hypothetical protein
MFYETWALVQAPRVANFLENLPCNFIACPRAHNRRQFPKPREVPMMRLPLSAPRVTILLFCLSVIARLTSLAQEPGSSEREITITLPPYLTSGGVRTSGGTSPPEGIGFGLSLPGVRGQSAAEAEYFKEHIQLTLRSAKVASSGHLARLLEANGVEANADAVSLVYDHNPTMLTASVSAGSKLVIPTILTDLRRHDRNFEPRRFRLPCGLTLNSRPNWRTTLMISSHPILNI